MTTSIATGTDWDRIAAALEEDSSREYRYSMCLRYLPGASDPVASVCDVGCGEGSGLLQLRASGYIRLTGIEVSAERLRRARERLGGGVGLVHISGRGNLPFGDDSFDAVISAAVIEHTANPEEHVRELARLTKPGGTVIIASDCYTYRIAQALGLYRSVQPIDRAIFPLTLLRYFRESGLHLVHAEGFPIPGEEFRMFRLVGLAARRLIRRVVPGSAKAQSVRPDRVRPRRFAARPWRPRHWLRALPGLFFSDENVFSLVKRMPPSGAAPQRGRNA